MFRWNANELASKLQPGLRTCVQRESTSEAIARSLFLSLRLAFGVEETPGGGGGCFRGRIGRCRRRLDTDARLGWLGGGGVVWDDGRRDGLEKFRAGFGSRRLL